MHIGLKVILLVVVSVILIPLATAQVNQNDLIPLLSAYDQKSMEKIESTLNKGNIVEDEANIIKGSGATDKEMAKNEKKYTLKRLEASQYYQKAYSGYISLLNDNINKFWKSNKNTQIQPIIKNNEDKANELVRKARSLRNVAEDLTYPDEKLAKIIEAEEIEKEATGIFIKVLYAYLKQPIDYDVVKVTENGQTITYIANTDTLKLPTTESNQENGITYIPVDTVIKKDSVVKSDSVKLTTVKPENITLSKTEPVEAKIEETLLNVTSETKTTEKVDNKTSESIYNMVDINEDQVDKFNKFLEDSYPENYEYYVINFRDLNYRDIDSLKYAWHQYIYAQPLISDTESIKKTNSGNDSTQILADINPNQKRTVSEPVKKSGKEGSKKGSKKQTDVSSSIKNENVTNTLASVDTLKTKDETSDISQTNTEKFTKKERTVKSVEASKTNEKANVEIAKGFIYRVQVSACRIPLDSISLISMYDGNLPILELKEDGWFKYAVGEFNTYNEAKKLKKQMNVPGAFIIAYLNGKRISIINTNASQYSSISSSNNIAVTYKVQICASKIPLDKKYINNIYSGSEKVEEFKEAGWYKYAIVIGTSLHTAKNFIQKEEIPGAFITSYIGNKKIELKEAIRLNKLKSNN